MQAKLLPLFSLLLISLSSNSQSLPDEMHLSTDGRMLLLGDLPNTGLYDQSQIKSIYLTFPQSNYWSLMQSNYTSKTDIPATMVVDNVTYDSVGVRFKGQTSYSQSGSTQKKSFNITLDYAHPNQNLMGYQTLNLNNCFQDESFIREIFYTHQIKKHIPSVKSAYVKLYINGQNWGVYPNVQQLNKDFLKEWFMSNKGTNWRSDRTAGAGAPGWGDGTGALNYLTADTTTYKTYYALKSYTKPNKWDDLVNTCNILKNTSLANLPTALPAVLDVDRTLWFLASEILFSDDDSYIYKGRMDYYAYWEIETGRMTPQEYDGNSVMDPSRQNWSPFYNETNANYPLMNRLFAVPEYRQRYLAHLRTLISELYDATTAPALIDSYKAQIDTMVQNDTKKIYTYTQFQSEITILKNFITSRRNYLNTNTEVAQQAPTISNVAYYTNSNAWTAPAANQASTVRASATSASGIYRMNMYYSNAIVGNFTKLQMFDDGTHDDGASGDGVYGAQIPGQAGGSWVRFYVEAAANNSAKSVKYDPVGAEHNVYVYIVAPLSSSDTSVVINEVMASNSSTAMDNAGEYDDWIELYNKSSAAKDISGYILTDNPTNLNKWSFPTGTIIPANGYLIAWADEDSTQGTDHSNFKLSASSEKLYLLDPSEALVDSLSWSTQTTDMGFARIPNGYGNFVSQSPTFNAHNSGTGISELSEEVTFMAVYPNPASDKIKIAVDKNTEQKLVIMNAISQQVYSTSFTRSTEVNIANWPAGFYIIHCGNMNKKLIVQH